MIKNIKKEVRTFTDCVVDSYKKVEKIVISYEADGEKFTHYYDSEKDAKQHLKYLQEWEVQNG